MVAFVFAELPFEVQIRDSRKKFTRLNERKRMQRRWIEIVCTTVLVDACFIIEADSKTERNAYPFQTCYEREYLHTLLTSSLPQPSKLQYSNERDLAQLSSLQ